MRSKSVLTLWQTAAEQPNANTRQASDACSTQQQHPKLGSIDRLGGDRLCHVAAKES